MEKVVYEAKIKDKLILLIILSLAAGFFLFQSLDGTTSSKIVQSASKTINSKDTAQFSCNNPGSEISKIIDEQKIQLAPQDCLYEGCSGFTY
jgi:hypothetical protein